MKCLVLSVAILSVSTAEQCSAPELENGVVVAEQNLQQNTFTGTFQCNRGFVLHGSRILKCRNGNWNYKLPVCSAERSCEKADLPGLSNGRARAERGMRGSVYRFQCNKGYKLVGPKTVYCSRQGWVLDTVPACVSPRCDKTDMDNISYGVGVPVLGGAVYRYQCREGARLEGPSVLACDGKTWNGTKPHCYELFSANPEVPDLIVRVDGLQTTGQSVRTGQNVSVSCTNTGGYPSPTLSIFLDKEPVKPSLLITMEKTISYSWIVGKDRTRWRVACKAENSASDMPALSDNIELRLNYATEGVKIVGKSELAVGEEAHYSCQSEKSNPASDVDLVIKDQTGKNIEAKHIKMKKTVDDGFVSWSLSNFKIQEGTKKVFIECRAVNQVGMAISDRIVNIKYPPETVEITGPQQVLENESQTFSCSTTESNPAVSLSWFISVDDKLERLSLADTESATKASQNGWVTVSNISKSLVAAPHMAKVMLVCVAEMKSLAFRREAAHSVEILRPPTNILLVVPKIIVKDKEYIIACGADGTPAPTTSVTFSSSATQLTNIPVRKEGNNFWFTIPALVEQVKATCVATNTAGTVQDYLDIPVIYPAQGVHITGPDYIVRGHTAIFSCKAKQGRPHSEIDLVSTWGEVTHPSDEEISVQVVDNTKKITVFCTATNEAGEVTTMKSVMVYAEDDLKQTILLPDSLDNVDISYGTDIVSRKRIVHITEAVINAQLDKLVEDVTAVRKVVLEYKTVDTDEWTESIIDVKGNILSQTVNIPEFCKAYQFQLVLYGSDLSVPVRMDLPTVLGPADPATTILEVVPEVENLKIFFSMETAEVAWEQPACVEGYKYSLFHLEDCPDEEEFQDCALEFGLNSVGYEDSAGQVEITLPELESCMEYVFMVKSFNSYGESKLVTKKFRTRETNNTDIDLDNFARMGDYIPTITEITVQPESESAMVSWVQPECFPEYELQIVELDKCQGRELENCEAEFSADIYDLTEEYKNNYKFDILDPCTEYAVMGRTTGDTADGELRVLTFTTHCNL